MIAANERGDQIGSSFGTLCVLGAFAGRPNDNATVIHGLAICLLRQLLSPAVRTYCLERRWVSGPRVTPGAPFSYLRAGG
jgi:hypothetical protein